MVYYVFSEYLRKYLVGVCVVVCRGMDIISECITCIRLVCSLLVMRSIEVLCFAPLCYTVHLCMKIHMERLFITLIFKFVP